MTILTFCAEDCDLLSTNGILTWATGAGTYRTAYARGVFNSQGQTAGDPPANRFRPKDFSSASSEFWLSFRMYWNYGSMIDNLHFVRFYDAGNTCRLMIRASSTNAQLKFTTRNDAATLTDLATSTTFGGASPSLRKMDLYVKYAGDGTGTLTLYENGVQVLTYAGANTTNGATALQGVEFCTSLHTNSASAVSCSEIIVSTTDTRAMGLCLLNSTTAGNAQQWSGTATNVNQTPLVNDASYIYSGTANQIQQYKPGSLPSGNFTVDSVCMSARALRGATGPQKFDFVTRIGSTDYLSSDVTPTTAFANYQNVQATNPGTSSAWVTGNLADTNFQYGVKSIA